MKNTHTYSAYIPIDIATHYLPNPANVALLHDNHSPTAIDQLTTTNNQVNENISTGNRCHNSNGQGNFGNHNSNGGEFKSNSSGSPKKTLAMIHTSTTRTNTNTNSISSENTPSIPLSMSLASIALQKHLNTTVNSLTQDKENAPGNYLSAQLQIKNDGEKWGVLVHGEDFAAVEAVKSQVMRMTPKLLSPGLIVAEDECEFENVCLFETAEKEDATTTFASATAEKSSVSNSSFTFNASLHQNLLLGPKHHLITRLLRDHNCTVSFSSTNQQLIVSNEAGLKALQARQDRLLQPGPLPQARVLIPADKVDWMWLSGQWKRLEEILWRNGAALEASTTEADDCYRLTALSGALLNKCLEALQSILTSHQTISLLFACRDDLRDYPAQLQSSLQAAAHSLGCTIKHIPMPEACHMGVEIGGESGDVARMAIRLQSMTLTGPDARLLERKQCIQVPAEIKEFICGKKDGKLMRIMKETGVMITLHECPGTETLFIQLAETVVQAGRPTQLPMASQLLQGELPAQLSFHVPETHHKRMIGHGGKAIQRIMKKWGVYVKFLNSFEAGQLFNYADPWDSCASSASLAGPIDNVIVKTPGKNAAALQAIKAEIFALDEADGGCSLAALQRQALSRVSIPGVSVEAVKKFLGSSQAAGVEANLQERTLWLESSSKDALTRAIDFFATAEDHERVITRSPTLSTMTTADDAFKHFPSALFVQSHASLSASGSPLLSEEREVEGVVDGWEADDDLSYSSASASASASNSYCSPTPSNTSSVAMNSLSGSPSLLPVGSKESLLGDDEVEGMIASIATKRQFWLQC